MYAALRAASHLDYRLVLLYFYMSPSKRPVCDYNKSILYIVLSGLRVEAELTCCVARRAAEQLDELDYENSTLKVSNVRHYIIIIIIIIAGVPLTGA